MLVPIEAQRAHWRLIYREFRGLFTHAQWVRQVVHHAGTRPTTPEAWLAAAYAAADSLRVTRARVAIRRARGLTSPAGVLDFKGRRGITPA